MRKITALTFGIAVAGMLYLALIHYTDTYEVAIVRNLFTGELQLDDVAGFNITPPWVQVARIDIRPQRVCLTSSARAFNCKLVQFDPRGYREFVATQGFRYYWWNNRLSFNSGYSEEYRGIRDVLRGYAFSGKSFSFLKHLREYQ